MDCKPPDSAPTSSFVLYADEAGETLPASSATTSAGSQGNQSLSAVQTLHEAFTDMNIPPKEPPETPLQQESAQDAVPTDQAPPHPQESQLSNAGEPTISSVLSQLSDNTSAIRAAEEVLEHLVMKQTALMQLQLHLEQQLVISAFSKPLGFHQGRPVAAILLSRCLQHWGILAADEAPVLDQIALLLQEQLQLEDESAPAELAGLQGHVAYWLTVSAVLYCLLLKATNPDLAAAALRQALGHTTNRSTAAEVMTAARKRVGELQQQLTERLRGWGTQQQQQQQQQVAEKAGQRGGWFKGWGQQQQQQQQQEASSVQSGSPKVDKADTAAAAAAAGSADEENHPAAAAARPQADIDISKVSTSSGNSSASSYNLVTATAAATEPSLAAAAAGSHRAVQNFMLNLDSLIQRCFALLRDQLKRRLAPLLADCMLMADQDGFDGVLGGGMVLNQGLGDQQQQQRGEEEEGECAAAAAVAGASAADAQEAETALMNFRCWSEVVGVFHAALVALRSAGVPKSLTAALIQQVLEFVNVQLFNQLLLRPECRSATNARFVLRGLKQLDGWILHEQHASSGSAAASSSSSSSNPQQQQQQQRQGRDSKDAAAAAAAGSSCDEPGWEDVPADEFDSWQPPRQQQQRQQRQAHKQQQQQQYELHDVGPEAWDALSHLRQALQFLVLEQKGDLTLDDLTEHVCPVLNHQQLYRLCTTAWSASPGEGASVSGEVLEEMKRRHTLNTNGGLIVTYLLDEPSGLPFVQKTDSSSTSADAPAAADSSIATRALFGRKAAANSAAAVEAADGAASSKCKATSVVLWDDLRDYSAGMPIPGVLLEGSGCPASVFGYLKESVPWPPSRK